tara:strand:+ start:201 stop:479 length:279 start_codon:yes stop_codon:yes gene_type:complete
LEKQSGGLRSATFPSSAAEAAAMKIPNEMLQLLTLMHANPHDRYVVLIYVFFHSLFFLTNFYFSFCFCVCGLKILYDLIYLLLIIIVVYTTV